MTAERTPPGRRSREASALRANLLKRKAQARARAAATDPDAPDDRATTADGGERRPDDESCS